MMTRNKYFIISLTYLLLSSGLADAAVKYRFELILFEYTNARFTESETWPEQPGDPDFSNALVNIYNNSYKMGPADMAGQSLYMLNPDQLILKKEVQAIKRSSSRKLLLHSAWVQSMHDEEQTRPVAIHVGKNYTTPISESAALYRNYTGPDAYTEQHKQLEGTIRISISRYLHVWTDLVFRRPRVNESELTDAPTTYVQPYRYRDHRKMRSKELHYIDNPSFGILIYALPVR